MKGSSGSKGNNKGFGFFSFFVRFHDKLSIDDTYETLEVMIGSKGMSHREIRIMGEGILIACLGCAQCYARH